MSRSNYTPRRCSKRWLDGDCPPEVLCIIEATKDDPAPEKYDVFFTKVWDGPGLWMSGVSLSSTGTLRSSIEMRAHQVSSYRYRSKGRYRKWTEIPQGVRAAVRREIKELFSGAE